MKLQYFLIPLIAVSISLLSACTSTPSHKTLQAGVEIHNYLASISQSDDAEMLDAIRQYEPGAEFPKETWSNSVQNILLLYRNGLTGDYKEFNYQRLEKLVISQPELLTLVLQLYPINRTTILKTLNYETSLPKELALNAAIEANIDPTLVLPAPKGGFVDTVTPLIHSASIVLYNKIESSKNTVEYRRVGNEEWMESFDLTWEPVYGSLSGSLVYLDADTSYDVRVTVIEESNTSTHNFSFSTKPNTPPINPDKIYYLSDIYSGGQLNLEELNIFGSEDGYAKIVGDGTVIDAGNDVLSAVHIGRQAYVMLENLTIKGGRRYGIYSDRTHHIWIEGCDISNFGRAPAEHRNGIAYQNDTVTTPINYDSGIYLEKTGVSVIEDCNIHTPNVGANHWGYGHPKGANAIQVWAFHPSEEYRGQMIIRNNRLYGTNEIRFNDVIEGRKNTWRNGGFVRDSAIYGNYLAYANDDLIELDGGQRNVLFYDNELTQGYAGVSIAPNMLGPSYIFHNYIHDLGDQRKKEWTAIKAGGLLSKPSGKAFIIENLIVTNRNGIAASRVANDNTFWLDVRNNIIITRKNSNKVGYGIFDEQYYDGSSFLNNLIHNVSTGRPKTQFTATETSIHPLSYDEEFVSSITESIRNATLPLSPEFLLPAISREINVNTDLTETSTNTENTSVINTCDTECSNKRLVVIGITQSE